MVRVGCRTVLVIDDDEDITSLIEVLVTTRTDYCLLDATSDPFEGAARAAAERPRVVIVGAHRSTFQPVDLIARLRRHDDDACIVLLADLADPITLLDALGAGATTVLSSGWGWSELMPTLDLLTKGAADQVA